MNENRLQEIRGLRDAYGDSTDQSWTPAYLALVDLLAEIDSLRTTAVRLRADRLADMHADCPLTESQLGAVVHAANGVGLSEHAQAFGVSPLTIRSHRHLALAAVRTHSLTHAVAIGLAERWIGPELIDIPRRWS